MIKHSNFKTMNQKNHLRGSFFIILLLILGITSCRRKDSINPDHQKPVQSTAGFYVLNEGSFGQNNTSLDYFDFDTDSMYLNVFDQANPNSEGLGDTGNDLGIYGGKLYIVVNNSNKIVVANAKSVKKIKKIDLSRPRNIEFYNGKTYVTSSDGFVAVIDTASLNIEDSITVGSSPEQMSIVGNKLYVANSGGFNFPNYDSTLSVINLNTNKEIEKITVGLNPTQVVSNENGDLYVLTMGNYNDIEPNIYSIDTQADSVFKALDIAASKAAIHNNRLYLYQYDYATQKTNFTLINTETNEIVSHHFIDEDIEQEIAQPYGIAIQSNGNIILSDGKDNVTDGSIYYFNADGNLQWTTLAGVSPSCFAFLVE